jgi:hypothetical protein
VINGVIVNNWLPDGLLEKYQSYGYQPVKLDRERCESLGVQVVEKLLVDENDQQVVRHNPAQLGRAIIQWFKREYSQNKQRFTQPQVVLPTDLPVLEDVPEPDLLKAKQ